MHHVLRGKELSPSQFIEDVAYSDQAWARTLIDDQICMAASINATGFVYVSGADCRKTAWRQRTRLLTLSMGSVENLP